MSPSGSALYGELYGTRAMRAVFSIERRLRALLDVEVALARAEASTGVIPAAAAEAIAAAAVVERLDVEALVAETENVGYPVVPLTKQLARLAGPAAGGYVHWGATTQDILDTASVLQLDEAFGLLLGDLRALVSSLAERALKHRDDVMPGRTHLQHALPITFGYTCALWLEPLRVHLSRLSAAREAMKVVQFGGAVGTLASLGSQGPKVACALAAELHLRVPLAPWHVDRSGFAEAACALGIACGSLAKVATDIVLLMQTEVGEVFEPHTPGRGGSSTMPQKRNPIASEYVLASARGVQALVPVLLGAMAADHERATGPWQSEEFALPQIFLLASAAFAQSLAIARGMRVDTARMRSNLDLTHGLIVSEAVSMALARVLGHARAHEIVAQAASRALETDAPLRSILEENPEVAASLGGRELRELLDPARYTGEAGAIVDRVVAAARATLSEDLHNSQQNSSRPRVNS